jgi:hypothetical protein
MGNEDFNKADIESEIEFEVIGCQFKQKDVEIIIVGKLLTLKEPEVVLPVTEEAPVLTDVPEMEGEKKVVITAPTEPVKKTRKLKKGGDEPVTLPPPPV